MARTDPTTIAPNKLGHRSRYSDSSFYDEICVLCGANDGDGSLSKVCSKAMPGDNAVIAVVVTETISRQYLIAGADVEAFRAAHDKAAAHLTDNTPPVPPKTALLLTERRRAIPIDLGAARA